MAGRNVRTKERATAGFTADEVFAAAVDLSTCQFRFVTTGSISGEVTGATGASDPFPIGVLQNAPTATLAAVVRVFGRTTIAAYPAACNLLPGAVVTANPCGAACKSGSLGVGLGRWLSASLASGGSSVAGEIFVNCILPSACMLAAS